MLQLIFQNVIKVTLSASVIIAILLFLLPLFRKKYSAKWRYLVWLVIAVRLLIPFSPSLPKTPIDINTSSQNIEIKLPVRSKAPTTNSGTVTAAAPLDVKESGTEHSIALSEILAIIWLIGIAVFILYNITGYFIFKKSVMRYLKPIDEERIDTLWCEVKEEMGVTENIRLLSCKKVISPMMTGFFKPILILPDLELDNSDLKLILKHELIHYKRKDIWYKLLMVCANGVHWFNPFVYLMTDISNKDMEMVCDSEVIKDSDITYKKKYSETILSVIHKGNIHNTAFSTYFHGGKKTMKKRFINIFDKDKKKKGIAALIVILVAVCLIGGLVAWDRKDNNKPVESDNGSLKDSPDSTDTSDTSELNSTETLDTAETSDNVETADDTDIPTADSSDNSVNLEPTDPSAGSAALATTDVSDNSTADTTTGDASLVPTDSSAVMDADGESITYENDQYGFQFTLPSSWSDYTTITDKWEGYSMKETDQNQIVETGPIISIRHPLWTSKNPRQDIPIMVFTLNQWDEMQQEDGFHIGAAPINPSELGRNSKYVFALPARYNFAFPEGFEEVEDIIQSAPLAPTEDIAK